MSNICATCIKNRRSPKTDPCGMPNKSIISIETLPLHKTRWDLSIRSDRIHVRVIPPKPKLDCSLDSKKVRNDWIQVTVIRPKLKLDCTLDS